jgi:GWxTD domain-containing protein
MDATDHAIMRNEEKIAPAKRMIPYLVDLSKEIKNPGRYSIVIHVKQTDKEATIRGRFSANWSNFEFSRLNINTAIEALKEFIPGKDFDTIGQSADSAKEAWFNQFWKDRDPTPDTDENELQEEYYRRVDFANNQFTINSLDKEGWKTDRGGIYIKYGAPTDVERHIDEMNLPPYEIWLYEGLQRRFIFEDKSGVGDFQLVRIE